MAIDDIKSFELLAFCFERFCIISMMFLSRDVPVNCFFAESILLNLAALLWRLLERQPLFDNGIFPKSIDGVSTVERVTLLLMAIFGVGRWMWLLGCVIFVPTNLIYLGCFIAKLFQKLYGPYNEILKKEVKTMQVEAEIQGNPKEGIAASKQNQTSTITNENLDHPELKSTINESNVSPSSSEKIDVNIPQGSNENGEELNETADRFDNKEDKADELQGFVLVEELISKSEEEEEEEAKLTSREQEEEEEEEEKSAALEDYYALTGKLYLEMQILKADFDSMRAEFKRIKKEHREQLRNCEEEKKEIDGKLCATTALSEVHQSLVREREESCRKLEEAMNDLAAKLCASTALLEISQSLLREKEESCQKFEAEKNDLAAKLCAAAASSELYRGLLHDDLSY